MNCDLSTHETRPRPLATNMTLPTFAAERQHLLSMDMFCPWGAGCSAAVDRWDRRKLDRFIDPATHMAVSAINTALEDNLFCIFA